MAKPDSARERLARLLHLVLALGEGRCPSAGDLAEACEVSRRTIYRDLGLLELAGVPVSYRADRRGYELPPTFAFAAPCLDDLEAAGLLLTARVAGPGDDLGLARAARSGARKLLLALPEPTRLRLQGAFELSGEAVDPPAPPPVRREVRDALIRSMAGRIQVRIWYEEADGSPARATKLSPYRLLGDRPGWRLIGRSSADRDVRAFAVPRIVRAVLTGDPYEVPPRFDPARLPSAHRREVRLRFADPAALDERGGVPGQLLEIRRPDDGGLLASLAADGLDEVLDWVVGFGDRVEVLAPAELRERLRELAMRMARAHAAIHAREPASARMGRVGG